MRPRRLLAACLVLALVLPVLAMPSLALAQSSAGDQTVGPTLDDKAFAIANELQCPVCQNETVAFSPSSLAAQMRQLIREKVRQGDTREQILQYFVDRYGDSILTQPPKSGFNLLAWFMPFAGVVLGLVIVLSVLRVYRPRPAPTVELPAAPLSEADERLVAQALEGLE